LRGFIDLTQILDVKPNTTWHKHVFSILMPKRELVCGTNSQQEHDLWVHSLRTWAAYLHYKRNSTLIKRSMTGAPSSPVPSARSAASPSSPSANAAKIEPEKMSAEELKQEAKKIREDIKKTRTVAAGLEKLVHFYASDPVQQKKSQVELDAIKKKLDGLEERKETVNIALQKLNPPSEQPKSPSPLPTANPQARISSPVPSAPRSTSTKPPTATEIHSLPYSPNQTGQLQAVALYDFEAASDAELQLKAGDTVYLLECEDGADWWQGQLADGSEGAFPSAYVKLQPEQEPSVAKTTAPVPTSTPKDNSAAHPTARPSPQRFELGTAEVLYDFAAQSEQELEAKKGDVITILLPTAAESALYGSEWLKAENNGREGIIPSSYVHVLSTSSSSPSTDTAQTSNTTNDGFVGGEEDGWDDYDYYEEGNEGAYAAVALYDFVAENENELSFKKGDVINLLECEEEEEWWRGEIDGREGIFPASYCLI
ncbi:Intersectin 1 (SH3 domain protein), partial [Balamuthia mandrillaris]